MKQRCFHLTIFLLCIVILIIFCTEKQKKDPVFAIIDSDSVTMKDLSAFQIGQNFTEENKRRLCLIIALSKQDSLRSRQEIIDDFQRELSMQTGSKWGESATEKLYIASKIVMEKCKACSSLSEFQSFVDQMCTKIHILSDSVPFAVKVSIEEDSIFKDTSFEAGKNRLSSMLYSLFIPEKNLSRAIAGFLFSEEIATRDSLDIKRLVKGLLFDSSDTKETESIAKKEYLNKRRNNIPKKLNSSLALKYRDKQSITDTIKKHQSFLKGLYKKHLKTYPEMSGIIYVTFRVVSDGEVISATIKSSQIKNKEFINPFLEYVKKISFKRIPEKVGEMQFDFPFEFQAQD